MALSKAIPLGSPELESPPPYPTENWISGAMIACERVYQDKSGMYILSGTFNKIIAGIQWPIPEQFNVLPLFPGSLYIRFLLSGPLKFDWAVWRRITSWGDMPPHQPRILAKGGCDIQEANKGMGEFKIDKLGGGLALTPERREIFNRHRNGELVMRYELFGAGRFVSALNLVFQYNLIEGAIPHELTPVTANDQSGGSGSAGGPADGRSR